MGKLFSYVKECVDTGDGYLPKNYITKNMLISKPDYYLNGKIPVISDYAFATQVMNAPNVIINKKEYSFNSKKVLIVNPLDEIEIRKNTYSNICKAEYTCIFIKKEFIEDMGYNILGKSKIRFSSDYNYITQQLSMLLLMFEKEIRQNQCGKELVLDCFETQLAVQLLRDFESGVKNKRSTGSGLNKNAIRLAVEFIEEYYNTNISLDEVANIANVSKFHFIRMFKQFVGETPYEYILHKRIKEAQRLLCANTLSISEIARLCGFINGGHFSTVFKNTIGVSPKDYIKHHR